MRQTRDGTQAIVQDLTIRFSLNFPESYFPLLEMIHIVSRILILLSGKFEGNRMVGSGRYLSKYLFKPIDFRPCNLEQSCRKPFRTFGKLVKFK